MTHVSDIRPLLEITGLSHSFGGLKAVSQFNLSVGKSDVWGIIGPNGAGKTTVFNLITGVYPPDAGKVLLSGRNLVGLPPHAIIGSGISRTFQNIRLFKSMTVIDNLITAGYSEAHYSFLQALVRTQRFRREEAGLRDRAIRILDAFGLANRRDDLAASLPYGLQRKVELARALLCAPSVLLLDEPGAGMNPLELDGLIALIRWIKSAFSVAIVLIEHRMRLVLQLCDNVKVLHFGETIFQGNPHDLKNNEAVVKAYFGDDHGAFGN
jgi:branched-chain amino acid transport system ATP-binding protein